MKISVYLPDDLRERVRSRGDINVSAVAQAALVDELARRELLAGLDEAMDTVTAPTEDGCRRFAGRLLWSQPWGVDDDDDAELRVWLTRRRRLAVHWVCAGQGSSRFHDTIDVLAAASWGEYVPEMVDAVGEAIGQRHVVDVDI